MSKFLICGCESAGNRLAVGILMARCGLTGNSTPSAQDETLDVNIVHRPPPRMMRKPPGLGSLILGSAGQDKPLLIMLTREREAQARSMVSRGHVGNLDLARWVIDRHAEWMGHFATIPVRFEFIERDLESFAHTVGLGWALDGQVMVDGSEAGVIDPLGRNGLRISEDWTGR